MSHLQVDYFFFSTVKYIVSNAIVFVTYEKFEVKLISVWNKFYFKFVYMLYEIS